MKPMKKATYREIPTLLAGRQSFRGNSITAIKSDNRYVVVSYETCIFIEENNKVIYFNDKFYSTTTSRLQNIIRKVFNV